MGDNELTEFEFILPYGKLKEKLPDIPDERWLQLKNLGLEHLLKKLERFCEQLRRASAIEPNKSVTLGDLLTALEHVLKVLSIQGAIIEEFKKNLIKEERPFPRFWKERPDGTVEPITDPKEVKKLEERLKRLQSGEELPKTVEGWRIKKRLRDGTVVYEHERSGEVWLWIPRTLQWVPPADHPDPNPITPEGKRLAGPGTM